MFSNNNNDQWLMNALSVCLENVFSDRPVYSIGDPIIDKEYIDKELEKLSRRIKNPYDIMSSRYDTPEKMLREIVELEATKAQLKKVLTRTIYYLAAEGHDHLWSLSQDVNLRSWEDELFPWLTDDVREKLKQFKDIKIHGLTGAFRLTLANTFLFNPATDAEIVKYPTADAEKMLLEGPYVGGATLAVHKEDYDTINFAICKALDDIYEDSMKNLIVLVNICSGAESQERVIRNAEMACEGLVSYAQEKYSLPITFGIRRIEGLKSAVCVHYLMSYNSNC